MKEKAIDWRANKVQKATSVCHRFPSSLFLRYPDIDAFAQDARLVFSNCAFYNEDDSEVCCHGDNLQSHLKWQEVKSGFIRTSRNSISLPC